MVLTTLVAFPRILALLIIIIIITVIAMIVIIIIVFRMCVPVLWGDIVPGGGLEWCCGSGRRFVRWIGRLWEEVAVTPDGGQWWLPPCDYGLRGEDANTV